MELKYVLSIFVVVVGIAYTWFMATMVKRDEEEQHRTQGNPNP